MYDYAYYSYDAYYTFTYLLVIIGVILSLIASARVKSAMRKYHGIRTQAGMSGAQVARSILDREGLYNVQVECLSGTDGDHYDPSSNTVRLSATNYNQATITAASVAAHECGHAIQHASGYRPVDIRSSLVPVVNFANRLSMPLIFIGVILSWNQILIQLGIWAFALTLLFQLVTLPVEFNASSRALVKLEQYGLLGTQEIAGGKKVLRAAALTYVAATAATALQLLRLILLYGGGGRRRRD